MVSTANEIFRDNVVNGVPTSGEHKPVKREIREWGTNLESFFSAIGANSGSVFLTRDQLFADLNHGPNNMAWVVQDPTVAFNGIYLKSGGSGSGSWTRVLDLPFSFIIGTDVGAGTPNAIQITTSIPVSENAIILFSLADATTGSPVTVSINSGSPITIKTNRGVDVSALTVGMDIWFRIRGSEARMLNDQDVSALVAQAEDALAAAEIARDEALSAAGEATGRALIYPASPAGAPYDASLGGVNRRIANLANGVNAQDAVTKSQLDATKATVDASIAAAAARIRPRIFGKPTAFDWPGKGGFQIAWRALRAVIEQGGKAFLDWPLWGPPDRLSTSPIARYYVTEGGNDSSAGTSETTAFKTVDKALSLTNCGEIVISPGIHINAWSSTSPLATQVNIYVVGGGRAQFITGDLPAFSSTGTPGVYQATGTSYDFITTVITTQLYDTFGNPLALNQKANLTALNAAASGWTRNGTTTSLFIKLPGGVAPGASAVIVGKSGNFPAISGAPAGGRYYIKGCEFYGGQHGFYCSGSDVNVTFEDCIFAGAGGASTGNGLSVFNLVKGIVLKRCVAFANFLDGFNYKDTDANLPTIAIEMDCISVNNGWDNTTGINNGSTSHDHTRIVRSNGIYGGGNGPSVADVGDVQSWNIGCTAFGATAGTAASFQIGDNTGSAKMWLDNCVSYGSTYDIHVDNGAVAYTHTFDRAGSDHLIGTGTVTPY